MAWGTSVNAIIAALTASWQTQMPTVTVTDGMRVSDQFPAEAVIVGYDPQGSDTAFGVFTPGGFQVDPDMNTYTIHNTINVVNGNADIVAARTRAWQLLAVAGGAIAVDPTVGGLVMHAALGTWSLAQSQTSGGAVATLIFSVDVQAFTAQ